MTDDPIIKRSQATRVGKLLTADENSKDFQTALPIAQQWRNQHLEALQECFEYLTSCSKERPQSIATFRLKRMKSIIGKLSRPDSHYKLGELQDIAGCRLILPNMLELKKACSAFKSMFRKEIKQDDYLQAPELSGYRSIHFIPKFDSYGSLAYRVEVQIRTHLQHLWATAVESAGEIFNLELKNPQLLKMESNPEKRKQTEDLLAFFRVISSLFALEEGTTQIPGYQSDEKDLCNVLWELSSSTKMIQRFQQFCDDQTTAELAKKNFENPGFFLIKFSSDSQYSLQEYFPEDNRGEALKQYNEAENNLTHARNSGKEQFTNTVLVYTQNPQLLATAYPNYSANIKEFIDKVEGYLSSYG